MSSSSDGLSQEEFLRLQEQLIDLRNTNYELKEKLKNAALSNIEPPIKKDPLQFATRLLNRSLTEKERETQHRLEDENQDLRARLVQQEEEFRLQQQTFIAELNKVVRQCEDLQKELEANNSIEGQGDRGNLLEEKRQWAEEKAVFEETVLELRGKVDEATRGLEEQTVCVRGLENTVLEVRRENEQHQAKYKETECQKEQEIREAQKRADQLEEEEEELRRALEERDRQVDELRGKLDTAGKEMETLKATAAEANKEIHHIRDLYLGEKREKEALLGQARVAEERQKVEHETLAENHQREMDKLREEMESGYTGQITELQSQLDGEKLKNKGEMGQVEETHRRERETLERRIAELEGLVGTKDEEKQLALKKQSMLLKELQKALKEEKRRAESVEKAKEREWHVVDPDTRSNTYDGNESISSLSALESDNVELINKLGTLQKAYADAVDKVRHLEHENECQQREILEKSELIENWIRSRPMPSALGTQKNENPLRKFLANTLAGDEQVTDLKEMNRKLQRMLEETLSKNMILQRDLQTLIERTEM